MDLSTITVADFKAFFSRDFSYAPVGNADLKYVQDTDITRAFSEATPGFNQGIFGPDSTIRIAYLLLSAHWLAYNLGNSVGGSGGGGPPGPVTSRTVGNVSESYQISKAFIDDPILGFYNTTAYGRRFLAFIRPYMVGGGIGAVRGTTQP